MANVITINITSGGSPVTTGSYDLRVSPYSSSGVAGSHAGGGNWVFAGLDDTASYKLYNTVGGTEVTSITGGGTNTLAFYDTDLGGVVKTTGTQTVAGDKTFSSVVACSTAATSSTHLMRYGETVRTTGNQAGLSGIKTFSDAIGYTSASVSIASEWQFPHKKYVDDLVGSGVGMIQSTYKIKLIPTRTTEDEYSRTTGELCNTYLSGLSNIATYTGVVQVEPLGQATNTIDVDNSATTAWISAGVWYVGQGSKPILNRKANNSSITATCGIVNCRIKDGAVGAPVVASRTYVNWTFQDCEFDVPDETDITFTTCKFLGINKLKSASGNTITLTNCTGDMFWYNDLITPTVTGTQPNDLRAVTGANLNW